MRSTRDKEPPGIEALLAAVYPEMPEPEGDFVSPDSDYLNPYQDLLMGMDVEDMMDIMKSGIQRVESADGTPSLMMSPTSSATGLYGQLYKEIRDLPFMRGISREQFRDDRDLQNRVLEMRMRGELPNLPGLYRNARELREEYAPQFEERGMYFNYRPDEIAALTNYLGRQGTREYFASLRDGTTFTPPGPVNKSPEAYLERYNEGVLDYMDRNQEESFEDGGKVGDKIRVLKKEGKPQNQAVAIALNMLERGKL